MNKLGFRIPDGVYQTDRENQIKKGGLGKYDNHPYNVGQELLFYRYNAGPNFFIFLLTDIY